MSEPAAAPVVPRPAASVVIVRSSAPGAPEPLEVWMIRRHQTMKFLFTKTMVYERSLIDGKSEPVVNRTPLVNQTPSVESLEVDFADASGKIFKGTHFDFGLTRTRGYEAGEYKVEVRTSDGTTIGSTANLTLKGDNPVVEWTRGSALKPLLDALEEPERAAFLAEYSGRIRRAYPPRPDGRTLLPFRRLFIVAVR